MVKQERASTKPESFFQNAKLSEDNPLLITAQLLVEKGVPLIISENAIGAYGEKLSDYVAIHATGKARDTLFQIILHEPEFRALEAAFSQYHAPDISDCQWDEQTRRKFWARYWQNLKGNKLFDQKGIEKQIQKFSDVEPLTPNEIRSLLEEVVDRVLAQSQ